MLGKIPGNFGMSGPFPLFNVATYWKCRNTKPRARKLSQLLANKIDNGGEGGRQELVSEFM